MSTPRVWVGCLGCYNDATLNGLWADATHCEPVEIGVAEYREDDPRGYRGPFCKRCGSDEFWCFDHENFFGLLDGECSPVMARQLAELISAVECDRYPVAAVAAWADSTGTELSQWDGLTREAFEDAYCGEWESEADYARELADEIGAVPSDVAWPMSCIDWDHAWNELRLGGDNWSHLAGSGHWYIFRST
jgi:antirestriction protein